MCVPSIHPTIKHFLGGEISASANFIIVKIRRGEREKSFLVPVFFIFNSFLSSSVSSNLFHLILCKISHFISFSISLL